MNVQGWTAIVADIEADRSGPWICPERDDGLVEVRGIKNEAGEIIEWHLRCEICGAETYVRRGPTRR